MFAHIFINDLDSGIEDAPSSLEGIQSLVGWALGRVLEVDDL